MPEPLQVRAMTVDWEQAPREVARGRTAEARPRDRARICWLSRQGRSVVAIKGEPRIAGDTVRLWITRFNDGGLEGLRDRRRGGRPATHPPAAVGELVAARLTDPRELGPPFGSWTPDRLAASLNEERGIAMQRGRLGGIPRAEGLRWRTQATWFGDRPDPAFAAKRGPS